MTLNELKEKRNQLLRDSQAILLSDNRPDSEKRSAVEQMLKDADVLEADIEKLERIAKIESEERSRITPPRPVPGAGHQAEESAELRAAKEKKAFEQYIRYGRTDEEHRGYLRAAETRDLGTGTVTGAITGGNQLVPQAFYPTLVSAEKAWGGLLNVVNTRRTDNGAPMKIAYANDTAKLVSVVGEATQVSENDPAFNGAILSTDLLTTGVVKVSLPELQDSYFDIETFMRDNFGKRWARGLNNLVTSGSSSGNIASVVSGATSSVTTASPTAVDYTEIVAVYASLDPAYTDNATWTMNSTTRGYLLGVKDSYGRPLYIPNPTSGSFDQLLGRPVVLNQAMANIASATNPILFGDFNAGYMLRIVGDLQVVRLNERYMDTLEIGLIGYGRAGGIVTDAGTHPIVSLTQHS